MTVDELIAALQKLSADGRGADLVASDIGCEIDEIATGPQFRKSPHRLIVARPEEFE